MLNDVKSGKINVTVAFKLDRLTRSVYDTDDLLILQDKSHIYRTLNPNLFLDKILSMSNAPREEVKRLIATYIDKIEVNKETI